MSQFSKIVIVDSSLPSPPPPGYYTNIKDAAASPEISENGGAIFVESGLYTINPGQTVVISNNTTIIGRGNVVINLINNNDSEENRSLSAFTNANHTDGNTNITITGFKIVVSPTVEYGTSGNAGVIRLVNVKNCRVEKVHITVDPESGHGVYPGLFPGEPMTIIDPVTGKSKSNPNFRNEFWELFPASAIRFESTPINNPNKENSTGNIVRQCVISNFGRYMGNNPAVVESGQQRYGIGILFRQGKRNTIKHNQVRGARMCCMVEAEDACIIKQNIFREPVVSTYTSNPPFINNECLLIRSVPGGYTPKPVEHPTVNNPVVTGNIFYGEYPKYSPMSRQKPVKGKVEREPYRKVG